MPKLKAFYAGQNYPIDDEIRDMLGLPGHRRYGSGLIVAQTKAAAVTLAETLRGQGLPVSRPYASEMHVATGNDTEAMRDAGLFAAPAVFLMDTFAGPVVRVTEAGAEIVGELVRGRDTSRPRFEPVGTLHVTFTPDAVQALRALLDLVHYDNLALEWRATLPRELLAEGAAGVAEGNHTDA
jgi:hypothetical protein